MDTLIERNLYDRCICLGSRYVKDEEIEYCHDRDYIATLKQLKAKSHDELVKMTKNPDSVYFHNDTFESASIASGCLLNIVDAVCTNKVKKKEKKRLSR